MNILNKGNKKTIPLNNGMKISVNPGENSNIPDIKEVNNYVRKDPDLSYNTVEKTVTKAVETSVEKPKPKKKKKSKKVDDTDG
jgi:hypothetical protein